MMWYRRNVAGTAEGCPAKNHRSSNVVRQGGGVQPHSQRGQPENGDGISTGGRVGSSSADVGVFRSSVEAGALLDVFAWFYCAVVIEIGTEVAMAED